MPAGVPQEEAVTAGDDYWKAEAENWRTKWEQEASTILSLEQMVGLVRMLIADQVSDAKDAQHWRFGD